MKAGSLIVVDLPNCIGGRLFEVYKHDKKSGKIQGFLVTKDIQYSKFGSSGNRPKLYTISETQLRKILYKHNLNYNMPRGFKSPVHAKFYGDFFLVELAAKKELKRILPKK